MPDPALDFQKIHADFRPRIQRYLARLVGEFEAEDLTQEVFLRVSQKLDTFRGEASLSTWIYRIATNAALDRMRQPAFRRTVQSDPLEAVDSGAAEIPDQDVWRGAPAPSIEQQVHHREREACYCDFLERLPENYRLVVALCEIEEFTAREAADILGLSVDVVKIRLHRGRQRLLAELKAFCKPEDWL